MNKLKKMFKRLSFGKNKNSDDSTEKKTLFVCGAPAFCEFSQPTDILKYLEDLEKRTVFSETSALEKISNMSAEHCCAETISNRACDFIKHVPLKQVDEIYYNHNGSVSFSFFKMIGDVDVRPHFAINIYDNHYTISSETHDHSDKCTLEQCIDMLKCCSETVATKNITDED